RLGQTEMARMRHRPQGIDNPQIEIAQGSEALIGYTVNVRRIGDVPDAESQSGDGAMRHDEGQSGDPAPPPPNPHHFSGDDPVKGENRRVVGSRRRNEAIAEAADEEARGLLIRPYWDEMPLPDIESAKLVYAMGVVGMLMRVEHGIERIRAGRQHLVAQ